MAFVGYQNMFSIGQPVLILSWMTPWLSFSTLLHNTNFLPKMSDTRFIITTSLEGYINALVPSGKFNNCTIGFKVPDEYLTKFEDAYQKALEWGKNKMAGKRFSAELPKWDEEGFVKVSYGGESSTPMFPWVDTDGVPIDLDTQIWKGTVVKLIVDLKPYVFGQKVGCSVKVRGAQVLKLVSGGGSDSGGLDEDGVAALFGKTEGFKGGSPSFEPAEDPGVGPVGYDADDVPF
jgi:hypothetical protein